MTREELIELCEDSVVHWTKWHNRDSYASQVGIQSIYKGLTAGLDYRIIVRRDNPETWIIEFLQPIDFEKLKDGKHLEISAREDYLKEFGSDVEMFDGEGIDFHSGYTQTYMPSRERVNRIGIGNDWY